MLTEADIVTIQQFTGGEVETGISEYPAKVISFGDEHLKFELVISLRNSVNALFLYTSTQSPVLQYEFPATRVVATEESFHEGGFHCLASLNFYPEGIEQSALSITKSNGTFMIDPIWPTELPEKAT